MRYWLAIVWIAWVSASIFAQDELLTATISNPMPYIGEAITYQIEFSSVRDLSDAVIDLPDFIGFAQTQNTPLVSQTTGNEGNIYTIKQTINLFSKQVGNFTITPANIVLPETPFDSGIKIESNPVSISIQPLPPDAPETFSGAVGQFDINTRLDFPSIQAGSPNTLYVEIIGKGNIGQFTNLTPRFPDNWVVFGQSAIRSSTSDSLQSIVFPYQFFPTETGDITLPTINFSYFDPIEVTYKTIFSEGNMFTVEGEFNTNQVGSSSQQVNQLPLKPMLAEPDTPLPSSSFWLLWLITPLIAIGLYFARILSTNRSPSGRTNNRSELLDEVYQQLQSTQSLSPNAMFKKVYNTIIQYLRIKYQQDFDETTNIPLVTSNLPEQLQKQLLTCIEQAESGQYAPVSAKDAKQLLRRTYKTIQQIEDLS